MADLIHQRAHGVWGMRYGAVLDGTMGNWALEIFLIDQSKIIVLPFSATNLQIIII